MPPWKTRAAISIPGASKAPSAENPCVLDAVPIKRVRAMPTTKHLTILENAALSIAVTQYKSSVPRGTLSVLLQSRPSIRRLRAPQLHSVDWLNAERRVLNAEYSHPACCTNCSAALAAAALLI